MARARLRRIGPKETEQLITAPAPLASCRKHREQRKPAPVMPMRSEYRAIPWARERERAEGGQTIANGRA
jgi:hypothetical protein